MSRTTQVRIIDGRTPEERDRSFLPGMGHGKGWLMPLYDAFSRVAGVRPLQERAVQVAKIGAGQAVLDVGTGTGNLSLAVLRAVPRATVTGHDPDATALRIAARKAVRLGVSLSLVQGYADRISVEDSSQDHVISSFAVHHLDDDTRPAFGREAYRALRPGGRVTVIDFGGPGANGEGHGHGKGHGKGHGHGLGDRLFRRMRNRTTNNPYVSANLENGIVTFLADAGFVDAREVEHIDHQRFGPITIVQATR